MAVQIPHRVHTEIPEEEALRGDQASPWRSVSPIGPTEGVLDRGGTHHGGPRAYVVERATEALGVERGGIHERKKRDPYRAAFPEAGEELRGPGVLGAGLLRGHGRPGYGINPAIHRRARERRSKDRPNGDALDRRKR